MRAALRSVPLWVLVIAAAVPYLATLSGDFVYDDQVLLRGERPTLAEVFTGDLFGVDADGRAASGYWRPVTRATYFVESLVYGERPWGPHLDNVMINVLLALLVWTTARRVPALAEAAFPAALLFAVHPVKVESLAMVSGRTDPLALLFTLLAVRSLLTGGSAVRAVAWFALALGAKESAAMLAPLVAGAALVATDRDAQERRRRAWSVLAACAVLVLAFFATKAWVLHISPPAGAFTGTGSPIQRSLTFLAVLPRYLGLLVWPHPLSIVHDTDLATSLGDARVWLGVGLVLVALALARMREAPVRLGALFVLWTIAPASNLVPITYAFDAQPFPLFERYLFVPALGFAFVVAGLGVKLAGGGGGRIPLAGLAVVCGLTTAFRTVDFRDDATLFETDAAKTARPAQLLARAATARWERGEPAVALGLFERAVAADPSAPGPRIDKASMLADVVQNQRRALENGLRAGITAGADRLRADIDANLADARAMLDFVLAADPRDARALEVRGAVLALDGKLLEAAADLRRAAEIGPRTPTFAATFTRVALSLREPGAEAAKRGVAALDDAITKYRAAIAAVSGSEHPTVLIPAIADVQVTLLAERADLLVLHGDAAAAKDEYTRLLALAPQTARAHEGLAYLAKQSGDRDAAYRHIDEALRLDPDSLYATNESFTMLQEDGRTEEARRALGRLQDLIRRKGRVRAPPAFAPPVSDK